ncbi:unnamed protein product [Nippostrongylus brasiliensis]|uniref:Transmembrane protein n=1 Tax=Nippostrongylus brasiliensis TaxID=27835 RepID=A0A0N4XE01_NIPBR|nr:unnamed protein product [Nippostrongylus brasiliensis]
MSETPRSGKAVQQSVNPMATDDGSDGEMWGEESVRYLSPEEMELEMTHNKTRLQSDALEAGTFSKALIVVVLMALVVFVFFLSDRVHRQTAGTLGDEEL